MLSLPSTSHNTTSWNPGETSLLHTSIPLNSPPKLREVVISHLRLSKLMQDHAWTWRSGSANLLDALHGKTGEALEGRQQNIG